MRLRSCKPIQNLNPIRIGVTDSGLGGLSVVAGIASELQHQKGCQFESLKLLFFNALPAWDNGYNTMARKQDKIRTFNRVLFGIDAFKPDLIAIACNTLSVLYDHTGHCSNSKVPVLNIVDAGIQMVRKWKEKNPNGAMVIFGTQTTIEAESHLIRLIARGIEADCIVTIACPNLQNHIQTDPAGQKTQSMIKAAVQEAITKLPTGIDRIAAVLCCTHYGYSQVFFKKNFKGLTTLPVDILNPNTAMIADICNSIKGAGRNSPAPAISIEVLSRLEEAHIENIARQLKEVSPPTARALQEYRRVENLF
ncbi:MAG: hypothetical protein GY874_24350 [Desulfobacteraceae bacterium]|nr:hypothetical protein [Desulfobacteraceae bacterium]